LSYVFLLHHGLHNNDLPTFTNNYNYNYLLNPTLPMRLESCVALRHRGACFKKPHLAAGLARRLTSEHASPETAAFVGPDSIALTAFFDIHVAYPCSSSKQTPRPLWAPQQTGGSESLPLAERRLPASDAVLDERRCRAKDREPAPNVRYLRRPKLSMIF
jgi:hypothetical protein